MKFFKYILLSGVLSLPLVGCSDFLDEDNKHTNNENGNAYIEANPEVLRATTYEALKNIVTEINLTDLSTDLFWNWRATNNGEFSLFTFASDNGSVTNYYQNNYKAINYANAMIKYAGADSELGAQGRFVRALCYYYLTQQYGGVPFVTEYIMSSTRDYPRDELEVIYSSLIDDLTDIYNNGALPATDHTGNVSKQAVAALLAQFELAYGWDIDTKLNDAAQGTYTVNSTAHFTQAASWAEKAINNTALNMTFAQKWAPTNENNNEVIFQVNYLREGFPGNEDTGGHSLQNLYCTYTDGPTQTGQKSNGSGGQNQLSMKAMYLWGPGDTRFDGTFLTTCYNSHKTGTAAVWGTEGYYAYYNCTPSELAALPIAARFFPYYTTEAEVEQYITEHSSQTIKTGDLGIKLPYAAILNPTMFVRFPFGEYENGKPKSSRETFESFRGWSLNSPSVSKFDDPASIASTTKNDYRNVVLLHVSQMYLVAAEAYYMAGNAGASIAKINDVRQRAGAPATTFSGYPSIVDYTSFYNFTVKDIDLILDELARECYAERTRFADLRRTKQLVRYNLAFSRDVHALADMCGAKGDIKWYRPIPLAELDSNTAMSSEDQNPGY